MLKSSESIQPQTFVASEIVSYPAVSAGCTFVSCDFMSCIFMSSFLAPPLTVRMTDGREETPIGLWLWIGCRSRFVSRLGGTR